jgi:hypothetical protein
MKALTPVQKEIEDGEDPTPILIFKKRISESTDPNPDPSQSLYPQRAFFGIVYRY